MALTGSCCVNGSRSWRGCGFCRTRAAERRRVALLDDTAVDLAGLRFVGGTLCADGRLAGADATPALPTNEFIRVGRRKRRITGRDEAVMHKRTREVIVAALARPGEGRLVVVTHHAPHPLCLPVAYRTGWAAGNAASDLSQLTDSGPAALWVHGHIHATIDLIRPGGTRIVCNAAGPRACQDRSAMAWSQAQPDIALPPGQASGS